MTSDAFTKRGPRVSPDRRAIVVAIEVGDVAFGTMIVARKPTRSPYDTRDVSAAIELAGRVAITVERVLRYREIRDAAQVSQRMANQLDQLVRASIDVQQLRDESAVLAKTAERAREVFAAQVALVTADLGSDGPLQAIARRDGDTVLARPHQQPAAVDGPPAGLDPSRPWRAQGWMGAPVTGGEGMVAVLRPMDASFTADDEAILVLLAQMASTALDNTRLYHTTQESEARWRVLVEAAPISIVEVDLEGLVLWWNRAAAALFAWPDDGSAGESGASFAPQTATRLRALWSDVVKGSAVVDRELTAMSVGGATRDLAVSAAPLLTTAGAIHGILILVADVTDRRRLEEELRRAQRTEAIGQLAGGLAHDFNNLLTLITGYTELLKRRLDHDEHSRDLVTSVQTAAARAALLTGQLLTISRRQVARPVVLAPAEVLQSMAEVLERILGAGIELRWALDPDAGYASIDPGQLQQVILNLAINARDAMPGGGHLDIAVSPALLDTARSADLGVAAGWCVRILVADTGVGMDDETLRRCFEPLFTTKGPSRGTGLGLAAVKAVVIESGGAVLARSVQGRGSAFEVYLPAIDRDGGPAATAMAVGDPLVDELVSDGCQPDTSLGESGRTILVAEDDDSLRQLMARVLTRDGYRVLEASGGGEGLTVARGWPGAIDAVISDVAMPGMQGPEMTASLLEGRPSMRVLFISGGTDGNELASVPAYPLSFLAKPFKPSQLLIRVHELFETGGPASAA